MKVLTQYDGKGRCACIQLGSYGGAPKKNQYKNQMFEWALKVGWWLDDIELKRPNA